ncbi:MAG: hypothetical protein A2942_01205 [Candidatus Lloydbacteria bacterium RIFCSPLOWO2_01_FULL_50_20]|uniref:Glycosyltransferase 2-like domain-containing protein n=1 Tax=Candidatus Lloydbacteria bacterium RIFCSPLOWO2_01_FULL_50_20 TaxID=1798665 RepID=A0A1G2DIG8_9BACT|nr:MAG: hypothetical protein A3C13_00750 [Candidatus Lloydbacteria bacterium RIFCSPHIGHO2_02_FULL_50_11]OGZ13445.1 MAG: hypothetical protein A2942_01205 [Candidatus Lloydbacteria bacterium RIFCSPLOWO2_01_FULL_50_20]
MKFTLVIPAFNEVSVIVPTLTGLCDGFRFFYDIDWTILVVDNGSTDGTREAVLDFGNKNVKLLRVEEKGKGNAIRRAFAKTDADIFGFTDADFPIAPVDIISAAQLIMNNAADVVVGSRLLPQSKSIGREWWRTWSSHVFNLLARAIVGVAVSDTQCPLKLMNAKGLTVMLATREPTWFFDVEFFALLSGVGLSVLEIPVTWNEHRYPKRKSKLKLADSFRAVRAMFRIRSMIPAQLSLLQSIKR